MSENVYIAFMAGYVARDVLVMILGRYRAPERPRKRCAACSE